MNGMNPTSSIGWVAGRLGGQNGSGFDEYGTLKWLKWRNSCGGIGKCLETLQDIVFELYDLMRVDSLLGPQFDRFAKTDGTFHRLKVRTVDWLEWMIGGPMKYDGPDLYVAHASMHIDDMSYTQMMNLYQQVLARLDQIDDLTKDELLSVLEAQRGPIVDPLKEFQRDFEERMAKLREERELRKREFQKQKAAKAKAKAKAKAEAKAVKAKAEPPPVVKVVDEGDWKPPCDESPSPLPIGPPIILLCPRPISLCEI